MKRLLFCLVALGLTQCGRDDEQINCDDLLPAGQESFTQIAQIITDLNDPRNCAQCHTASEPIYGIVLETRESAFFTFRDRMDRVYAKLASGEMPKEGLPWSADDLRLLRSWYCRGAFND